MAKRVVKGAVTFLGGTDYSAQVASSELAMEGPEVDVTVQTSGGWQEFLQGLKSAQLTIEFKKDDAMALDAAVWAAFIGAGTLTFEIRPKEGAVGPTNPKFTGTAVITQWNPGPGGLGNAYGGSVTWRVTGAVTRAEA